MYNLCKYYKLLVLSKIVVYLKINVNFVRIFYLDNSLEIYPNHTPLLGIMKNNSYLFVQKKYVLYKYEIYDSLIEFSKNKLTILVKSLILKN